MCRFVSASRILLSLIFHVGNHVEMVWLHQLGDVNEGFHSSSAQWMLHLEILLMTQRVRFVNLFSDYLALLFCV